MASNVLPQAFFTVPASSTLCKLNNNNNNKLTFSAAVARRQFSGALVSSVCNKSCAKNYSSLFTVRAEGNADVEPEVTAEEESGEENVESVESADVAAEEEEEDKPRAPPRTKLGDIMGILNKRAIEASDRERPIPDLRTGDVVEIKLEVPENRRRLSVYKGIVISKQNAGIHTTIRIRRIIAGVGVEIVFPVYSPNIKEIRVLSHRKVRRARLYYLRDKLPRLSTFK